MIGLSRRVDAVLLTPKEHLGLPMRRNREAGVRRTKLTAHAATLRGNRARVARDRYDRLSYGGYQSLTGTSIIEAFQLVRRRAKAIATLRNPDDFLHTASSAPFAVPNSSR